MLGLGLNIFTLAIRRYFGGGGGQFAGSSLNLDFTSGNQSLDPRITFSRASNATVTGPDGVLGYAPHNLLRYSEQFDITAGGWSVADGSISANTAIAPDGTRTADKFVENTAPSLFHRVIIGASHDGGIPYTLSVHAKLDGRRWVRLSNASENQFAYFDLQAGVVGTVSAGVAASMTAVAEGFYRCSITYTPSTSALKTIGFNAAASDNSTNYTGDGVSGIFLWGAQLNVGALQPYYPTTVKNLLGYTQEFDNAAWTKTDFAVTANATTAPDGSLTADRLARATTTNTFNALSQASVTVVSGTRNTFSCYVKADQYTKFGLREGATSGAYASFNLATGTVIETSGTGLLASITPAGDGWYRCEIDLPIVGTSFGPRVNPLPDSYTSGLTSYSWAGNTTDGIYIWGAQLSDSASLDPYVYNPAEAPAASAYYGPRFDYDPVTLQPKGLLIEDQRVNHCLHSEDFTQAAWVKSNTAVTANTENAPNATLTADTIAATAASGTVRQAVTTTAVDWTFSVYLKRKTGTGAVEISMNGTTWVAQTINSTTWTRCIVTQTGVAGTSNPGIRLATSGDEVYAWGAQAE